MDVNTIYNSVLDEVENILLDACRRIQDNMAAKGINATGNTSESFRVERYDGGIRLVMGGTDKRTAPLETLEVGRPAGDVPGGFRTMKDGRQDVSNTFKWILIKWAEAKGLQDFGWGAATILGRRIAKEGTLRHRNPVQVYSQPVAEAKIEIEKSAMAVITSAIHEAVYNMEKSFLSINNKNNLV